MFNDTAAAELFYCLNAYYFTYRDEFLDELSANF
jgi:hypothetical protein